MRCHERRLYPNEVESKLILKNLANNIDSSTTKGGSMFLRLAFSLLLSVVFHTIAQETVPADISSASAGRDSTTHDAPTAIKEGESIGLDVAIPADVPSSPVIRDSMTHNAPAKTKADASVNLDTVVVKGKYRNFVETKENEYSGSAATKEGIAILGGPAQTSINQTIALFPSVNIESLDPYGLYRAQQTNLMRIRGQGGDKIAYAIDGVPLTTNIRMGPKENSFDMENFSDVTLYRGAAPTDQGFSFGNYTGTVAINALAPSDKPGVTFSQGAGMFGFNKIFLRANTGQVLPGFRSFISYSNATSDKWNDSSVGVDRQHLSFGADFSPRSKVVSAQLFADYQYEKSNNYRGLSYAQTQNLEANYMSDFNSTLTGDSTQDIYYYKFNKIEDKYLLIHGNIQVKPAKNNTFTVKPYFAYDDVWNRDGSASPLIRGSPTVYDWLTKNTRYGSIFDYSTRLFNTDMSIGYWMEMLKWPVYAMKGYTVDRGGKGNLTFIGWSTQLMTYEGNFMFNSPYLTISKKIANFTAHAGLKYLNFTQPAVTVYKPAGIGDISEYDISGKNPTKDTNACVGSKAPDVFLPSTGFSYRFNNHVTPYVNYGRDYGICYFGPGGMISGYWAGRAHLDSLGINADKLADKQKIPTADDFDLGIRLAFGSWRITPVIFYSRYLNKAVTIWDPVTKVKYRQTVGEARAFGSEWEIAGNLFSGLSLFASATFDSTEFIDNVPISSADTVTINGKQFPDCPKYMAKLGVSYLPKFLPGFEIYPVLRYVHTRYGDITYKEKVRRYTVGDITMAYKLKNIASLLKDLTLSFSILNVTDTKYISSIKAADETRGGATTYYAGYPLTCAWSINGAF
jgi:iron complex outermembrane recepter protein